MDADFTSQTARDLGSVNDGLEQALVVDAMRKKSVAGELKTLLQIADGSNVEVN